VQPLEQWEGLRDLIMREIGVEEAGKVQTGIMKMRYTYLGSRKRAGRTEAVIELTGEVAPLGSSGLQIRGIPLKADSKAKGSARGTAIVDLANGQVLMARILVDIDTEMTIPIGDAGLTETGRAGGRLELSIKRGR